VVSRRTFFKGAVAAVAAPAVNILTPQRGRFCLFAQSESEYSTAALDLVQGATVIDMLGLLTLNYAQLSSWETQPARFTPHDLAKLRGSGITIFHPAVGFTGSDAYASSLRDITG
jgi:membrane dipeptidase